MSIWADQQIKELRAEIVSLKDRVSALEATKGLHERYEQKFGKPPHHLMKPETIAERLK